ncbi:GNAT family N-acetyltransferase [Actinoplanes sp. M2I2]|uniref:GNAT family N-acetyltransferase n=1 Tax=Actinoplanes sp. M2I2 TaxID=1734444 RepID=UPI0020215931|nr:GNAT family N-acetyltransferase [Actinoplanes sp. M2I2]
MAQIRPITEADYRPVADIHVHTWQVAYAGIVPDEFLARLDPADFVARRRTRPLPDGAQTLVAEEDGRIAGFVAFGPYRLEDGVDPGAGELYSVYLHPGHWGRGTGRQLLEAARAGLTAAGFPDMRLWVLTGNTRARRFYERAGLKPDGVDQTWTPRGTTLELPELRYAVAL